jgi:hypothetical protein
VLLLGHELDPSGLVALFHLLLQEGGVLLAPLELLHVFSCDLGDFVPRALGEELVLRQILLL